MTLSRYFYLGALAFLFLLTPFFVMHAQPVFPGDLGPRGLAACGDQGEPPCDICQLENLARDLLRFAIYVAVFLATILIAYAGFRMVMAQGDTAAVKEAKEILTKAILGLVFVLSAWLIVDTLMKTFFSGGSKWNTFGRCEPQPGSTIKDGPVKEGGVTVAPLVPNNCTVDEMQRVTCPTQSELLQNLREGGVTVNNNVNLEGVNKDLTKTLIDVCAQTGLGCTLTAAKNGTHLNKCHSGGTCFDVVCPNCSLSDYQVFINNTQAKGYCAVYEPKGGVACPPGVKPCFAGSGSTGIHVSFYMNASQSPSCKL